MEIQIRLTNQLPKGLINLIACLYNIFKMIIMTNICIEIKTVFNLLKQTSILLFIEVNIPDYVDPLYRTILTPVRTGRI